MTQGQRDAMATAEARRDALLAEARVFRAQGSEWDAVRTALEARGFGYEGTGGGCDAFIRWECEDGKALASVWVTADMDPSTPETFGEPVVVGYYAGEYADTPVMMMRFPSLQAFLDVTQIQAETLAYRFALGRDE